LSGQHNIWIVKSTLQSLRLESPALAALASRAPQWVAGLLVVLLGVRAAWLVADLAGAAGGAHGARSAPLPPAPHLPPRLDLAGLMGANLFGAPAAAAQGPAPVTSAPLVLVGVMAAQDPSRGIAILGASAPAARVYLVGATLPGGMRLNAVYPDHVLIDRGGSLETLPLPRQPGASAPPPPPPAANAADRIQQLMQQNPAMVSNVLRPQVVLLDGRQAGFRVFPGPNQRAFTKLGLRPGDLVTAINGTKLDDPAVGNNVFATLSNAANARISIQRDGRQQELVLDLAQAMSEAERLGTEPVGTLPTDPTVPPP
jgi:general secretion pathway protein C